MTTSGAELLRLLAAGTSRDPAGSVAASPAGTDFAAVLDAAGSRVTPSGRTVSVAKEAGVNLSAEQIARLSAAADRAEAAGAKRAVVLIDGQTLQLDVLAREITAKVDLSAGVATGVDAVLAVPAGDTAAAVLPPGAGSLPANAALLRVLERSRNDNETRLSA